LGNARRSGFLIVFRRGHRPEERRGAGKQDRPSTKGFAIEKEKVEVVLKREVLWIWFNEEVVFGARRRHSRETAIGKTARN